MESKRKNVYITIFVITTIVAATLAVYFGLEYKKLKEDNSKQDVSVKESTSLDEKNEEKGEVTVKEVEKVVEKFSLPTSIDSSKCINQKGEYKLNIGDESSYVVCSMDDTRTKATLGIYWDRISKVYGVSPNGGMGNYDTREVTLNGKVKSVVCTSFGQTGDYCTVLFLLEDGTVEYIPLRKAVMNNNFNSCGKISNVSGVSYITGNVSYANGHAIIGLKDDGTFYNLSELLMKTGDYNF